MKIFSRVLCVVALCLSGAHARADEPQKQSAPFLAPGELGQIHGLRAFEPAPRGDSVAVFDDDYHSAIEPRALTLYKGTTGDKLWSSSISEVSAYSLAFSGEGRWVAVAGVHLDKTEPGDYRGIQGRVRVFDARTGAVRNVLQVAPRGYVHALALAPHAPILAVAGNSWIELWSYSTGKRLATFKMKGEVISLDFSSDGKLLVGASLFSPATLWQISTRKQIAQFPPQSNQTLGVRFSPDGKTLALAGSAYVSLYGVKQRDLRWKVDANYGFPPTYDYSPGSLSFSPDGRHIGVSGRIWSPDINGAILNAQSGAIEVPLKNVGALHFGSNGAVWFFGTGTVPIGDSAPDLLMRWPNTTVLKEAVATQSKSDKPA